MKDHTESGGIAWTLSQAMGLLRTIPTAAPTQHIFCFFHFLTYHYAFPDIVELQNQNSLYKNLEARENHTKPEVQQMKYYSMDAIH